MLFIEIVGIIVGRGGTGGKSRFIGLFGERTCRGRGGKDLEVRIRRVVKEGFLIRGFLEIIGRRAVF